MTQFSQEFKEALIESGYLSDNNFDGLNLKTDLITAGRINNITIINVNEKNLSNLDGIENFINLKYFSCDDNKLTRLDVTQNTNLLNLNCNNNK